MLAVLLIDQLKYAPFRVSHHAATVDNRLSVVNALWSFNITHERVSVHQLHPESRPTQCQRWVRLKGARTCATK